MGKYSEGKVWQKFQLKSGFGVDESDHDFDCLEMKWEEFTLRRNIQHYLRVLSKMFTKFVLFYPKLQNIVCISLTTIEYL